MQPEHIDPPWRLLSSFQEVFPTLSPDYIVQAPGREMWAAASIDDVDSFRLHAPDLDGRTRFDWRSAKYKQTIIKRPLPSWSRYAAGVTVLLCERGLDTTGVNAVFVGEESPGPRYDYALGIGFAALLHHIHNQPYTSDTLLEIMQQVQRDYINA